MQINPDMVDQVLGLNLEAQQFSFEVDLTMTADPDLENIGGGIIFNTPTAESKNGGQIRRFLNGGQKLF